VEIFRGSKISQNSPRQRLKSHDNPETTEAVAPDFFPGSSSQEASHRRIAKLNQHLQLNDVKLGLVKSQKMSENRSSLFVGPYLTPFKVILSAITCQVQPFEPAWRCEGESPGIYEKHGRYGLSWVCLKLR